MQKMMAPPKTKKVEFSKILAGLVATMFVTFLLFGVTVWIITDRVMPREYIDVPSAAFMVVLASYFGMQGYVNGRKVQYFSGLESSQNPHIQEFFQENPTYNDPTRGGY